MSVGAVWPGRAAIGSLVVVALVLAPVPTIADTQEASGASRGNVAVAGAIAMGDSLVGEIDRKDGSFRLSTPVLSLPGLAGVGAVEVGVSYAQDRASHNRFGLGAGWGWNVPFVDPSGRAGVTVYPAGSGA